MKRRIPVFILLFGILIAGALPAVVGLIARDRINHSLAENGLEQDAEWRAGWLRSTLRFRNAKVDLELRLRHVTLQPPGWLAFSGRALVTDPAASVDLEGKIALDGKLEAFASAPGLQIDGPATWSYRQPTLRLTTGRDGSLVVEGRSGQLLILDGRGNRLVLDDGSLRLEWQQVARQTGRAEIIVEGRRLGRPPSRIALRAEQIDLEALEELGYSLRALAASERGSAASTMAMLGTAGAWQQLAAEGLDIQLSELTLDQAFSLSGRFLPAGNRLTLSGGGPRETLLEWWSSVIGLARGLRPAEARDEARQALDRLARREAAGPGEFRIEHQRAGDRLVIAIESGPNP